MKLIYKTVFQTEMALKEEESNRRQLYLQEREMRQKIYLDEIEIYLDKLPEMMSRNIRRTYPLPEMYWQIQLTNGYIKFRQGNLRF